MFQAASRTRHKPASAFEPTRILEIELSQPLPTNIKYDDLTGKYYGAGQILVRLHTYPLGIIHLQLDPVPTPSDLAAVIWDHLHQQINDHLQEDGLPAIEALNADGLLHTGMPVCLQRRADFIREAPFASVIICTRDRPDYLRRALKRLVKLDYPQYEIIVVDNAPRTTATAEVVSSFTADSSSVHYYREDCPGVSRARNCGIRQARGEIVAFTDDDIVVDQHWLTELMRAFQLGNNVGGGTSQVLAAELETYAQALFEQYGGFSKGFADRIFDLEENRVDHPLYPYTVGLYGAGAGMAFRKSVLESLGGFDPALGPGTPTLGGGEDIALFVSVLNHGYQLAYKPTALAYHFHRRDYNSLKWQLYTYGIGLMAFLTKCIVEDPALITKIFPRIPAAIVHILNPQSYKNKHRGADFPKELIWLEIIGMLYGPIAYWWSRQRVSRCGEGYTNRSLIRQ